MSWVRVLICDDCGLEIPVIDDKKYRKGLASHQCDECYEEEFGFTRKEFKETMKGGN